MIKIKYLCCFSVVMPLFFACQKENFDINNLNNNSITVLGHAGMGIYSIYPIDSDKSFKRCIAVGADGVEFDVQMTADRRLVVFHDKELSDNTNGSGSIFDQEWSALQDVHYKRSRSTLLLADSLFSLVGQDVFFSVDCKLYNNDSLYLADFASALAAMANQYQLEDNAYFCVQQYDFAADLLAKKPNLKIFAYTDISTAKEWAQTLPIKGIVIGWDDISQAEIDSLHADNLQVSVFNTKAEVSNIAAVRKNVDFIETDAVIHLVNLLK